MTVHEVAKQVMKDRGYSQGEVAKRAGMKGQSAVGMWLQGKSMRVDNLVKLMTACGYEVIVRDATGNGATYRISNEEGADEVKDERVSDDVPDSLREVVRECIREELAKMGTDAPTPV